MKWVIDFILTGKKPCQHKWVEEERATIGVPAQKRTIGRASYCKCEKCGERRVFKMRGTWN